MGGDDGGSRYRVIINNGYCRYGDRDKTCQQKEGVEGMKWLLRKRGDRPYGGDDGAFRGNMVVERTGS